MSDFNSLLAIAIVASIEAGKQIMDVYDEDHAIEIKDDQSPLTIADKLAHKTIIEFLEKTHLPVLSEEGKSISYEERSSWNRFWMVDPLDGTKEFIKRNGEFTVNIALIEEQESIIGVIYAPVPDVLYFGSKGHGSYMLKDAMSKIKTFDSDKDFLTLVNSFSSKLPVDSGKKPFTIVASRSHLSPETELLIKNFKNQFGELNFISKGSSLKICLVAEGVADCYPRLAPTMEWDTAAGQAIAINAGCEMRIHPSLEKVVYNKPNLLNPHFVVSRK